MRSFVILAIPFVAAAKCRPWDSRFWVTGSQHKTGTVLLGNVMRSIWDQTIVKPPGPCCWTHSPDGTEGVTTFSDVPNGTIAKDPHMAFARREEFDELVMEAKRRGKDLRVIFFVRDPLEIILSAYFYHRGGSEKWVRKPMQENPIFVSLADSCRDPVNGASQDMAVCVLQDYLRRNATYHELLTTVDVTLGVVIEALGGLDMLKSLNTTASILREYPEFARIYDLDDVVASYDPSFLDIFSFLGADDVNDCVATAQQFDLNNATIQSGGRKHVMPTELTALRSALRLVLPELPWITTTIQPLRTDLGYSITPSIFGGWSSSSSYA